MPQAAPNPQSMDRQDRSTPGLDDADALGPEYRQRITPLGQGFLSPKRLETISRASMTVLNFVPQVQPFGMLQTWTDEQFETLEENISQGQSASTYPSPANDLTQNESPPRALQRQPLANEVLPSPLQRQPLSTEQSPTAQPSELSPQTSASPLQQPQSPAPASQPALSEGCAPLTPPVQISKPVRLPDPIRRSPQIQRQVKHAKTQILRSLQAQSPQQSPISNPAPPQLPTSPARESAISAKQESPNLESSSLEPSPAIPQVQTSIQPASEHNGSIPPLQLTSHAANQSPVSSREGEAENLRGDAASEQALTSQFAVNSPTVENIQSKGDASTQAPSTIFPNDQPASDQPAFEHRPAQGLGTQPISQHITDPVSEPIAQRSPVTANNSASVEPLAPSVSASPSQSSAPSTSDQPTPSKSTSVDHVTHLLQRPDTVKRQVQRTKSHILQTLQTTKPSPASGSSPSPSEDSPLSEDTSSLSHTSIQPHSEHQYSEHQYSEQSHSERFPTPSLASDSSSKSGLSVPVPSDLLIQRAAAEPMSEPLPERQAAAEVMPTLNPQIQRSPEPSGEPAQSESTISSEVVSLDSNLPHANSFVQKASEVAARSQLPVLKSASTPPLQQSSETHPQPESVHSSEAAGLGSSSTRSSSLVQRDFEDASSASTQAKPSSKPSTQSIQRHPELSQSPPLASHSLPEPSLQLPTPSESSIQRETNHSTSEQLPGQPTDSEAITTLNPQLQRFSESSETSLQLEAVIPGETDTLDSNPPHASSPLQRASETPSIASTQAGPISKPPPQPIQRHPEPSQLPPLASDRSPKSGLSGSDPSADTLIQREAAQSASEQLPERQTNAEVITESNPQPQTSAESSETPPQPESDSPPEAGNLDSDPPHTSSSSPQLIQRHPELSQSSPLALDNPLEPSLQLPAPSEPSVQRKINYSTAKQLPIQPAESADPEAITRLNPQLQRSSDSSEIPSQPESDSPAEAGSLNSNPPHASSLVQRASETPSDTSTQTEASSTLSHLPIQRHPEQSQSPPLASDHSPESGLSGSSPSDSSIQREIAQPPETYPQPESDSPAEAGSLNSNPPHASSLVQRASKTSSSVPTRAEPSSKLPPQAIQNHPELPQPSPLASDHLPELGLPESVPSETSIQREAAQSASESLPNKQPNSEAITSLSPTIRQSSTSSKIPPQSKSVPSPEADSHGSSSTFPSSLVQRDFEDSASASTQAESSSTPFPQPIQRHPELSQLPSLASDSSLEPSLQLFGLSEPSVQREINHSTSEQSLDQPADSEAITTLNLQRQRFSDSSETPPQPESDSPVEAVSLNSNPPKPVESPSITENFEAKSAIATKTDISSDAVETDLQRTPISESRTHPSIQLYPALTQPLPLTPGRSPELDLSESDSSELSIQRETAQPMAEQWPEKQAAFEAITASNPQLQTSSKPSETCPQLEFDPPAEAASPDASPTHSSSLSESSSTPPLQRASHSPLQEHPALAQTSPLAPDSLPESGLQLPDSSASSIQREIDSSTSESLLTNQFNAEAIKALNPELQRSSDSPKTHPQLTSDPPSERPQTSPPTSDSSPESGLSETITGLNPQIQTSSEPSETSPHIESTPPFKADSLDSNLTDSSSLLQRKTKISIPTQSSRLSSLSPVTTPESALPSSPNTSASKNQHKGSPAQAGASANSASRQAESSSVSSLQRRAEMEAEQTIIPPSAQESDLPDHAEPHPILQRSQPLSHSQKMPVSELANELSYGSSLQRQSDAANLPEPVDPPSTPANFEATPIVATEADASSNAVKTDFQRTPISESRTHPPIQRHSALTQSSPLIPDSPSESAGLQLPNPSEGAIQRELDGSIAELSPNNATESEAIPARNPQVQQSSGSSEMPTAVPPSEDVSLDPSATYSSSLEPDLPLPSSSDSPIQREVAQPTQLASPTPSEAVSLDANPIYPSLFVQREFKPFALDSSPNSSLSSLNPLDSSTQREAVQPIKPHLTTANLETKPNIVRKVDTSTSEQLTDEQAASEAIAALNPQIQRFSAPSETLPQIKSDPSAEAVSRDSSPTHASSRVKRDVVQTDVAQSDVVQRDIEDASNAFTRQANTSEPQPASTEPTVAQLLAQDTVPQHPANFAPDMRVIQPASAMGIVQPLAEEDDFAPPPPMGQSSQSRLEQQHRDDEQKQQLDLRGAHYLPSGVMSGVHGPTTPALMGETEQAKSMMQEALHSKAKIKAAVETRQGTAVGKITPEEVGAFADKVIPTVELVQSENTEETEDDTEVDGQSFERLAREVYQLLQQRLTVERERYGGYYRDRIGL